MSNDEPTFYRSLFFFALQSHVYMKIVVAIKRALDYTARVRVKPDGSGVDLSGARMSMNPFCEIALEVGRERREEES